MKSGKLLQALKRRLWVWRTLCPLLTAPAWDVELVLKQAADWQPNDVY